jgi:large conductance mechanosensitive channel
VALNVHLGRIAAVGAPIERHARSLGVFTMQSKKVKSFLIQDEEGAMGGFKQFLLRGNVVDMAVGIVIGAAFGTVVSSFVKDLLTPFIAAVVRKPDFSGIAFQINGSKFLVGDLVNNIISFVLVAAAVYYGVVLPINALVARVSRQPPAAPTTKKCPECISEIPIQAKKCAFCTSTLPA